MLRRDDRERRVPAVAGSNQHGVDVLTRQQGILIVVHLAVVVAVLLVNHRLDLFAPLIANVTDGNELCLTEWEQRAQVVCTARADADAAENDLVTGRDRAGSLTEHQTGDNHGRDSGLENLASCSHVSLTKDSIPICHVFMPYIGGFGAYSAKCNDVAQKRYEGFALSMGSS
jgi:hypothetical protein